MYGEPLFVVIFHGSVRRYPGWVVVATIPRHRSPKFMCELGHDDARITAPFDEGSRKTFAQFVEAAALPPRSGCSQRAPHRFMDK